MKNYFENKEKVIFPGFNKFISIGAIISGGKCTICLQPIDDCDHIEGMIYWGRLCLRVEAIMQGDHVALVDHPKDRRCVIREVLGDDGYYIDYMTKKRLHRAEEKDIQSEGLKASITLLKITILDIY